MNEGGRFYRSGAGARSLTEVVAAGIKKLEPVEAADFGRVEIERPEHEARARLGPEERRLAGQPFATIDHVTDPRGVGRIPKHADQHRPKGLALPRGRFDNHDQNHGASLKLGRCGTKVEHIAHYVVLSFDGTLVPSIGGDPVVDVAEQSGSPKRSPEMMQEGMTARRLAIRSVVLGIFALMIQLLAWGDWFIRERQHDAAFWRFVAGLGPNPESPDLAGVLIWSSVSVVVGISAIVFGVKGQKLAKAEASGRISATTGLVLGIVSVAIPILEVLAFINWLSCCLDNI